MGMCIKISDRQIFHMIKQLQSQITECSLGNIYHDQTLYKGSCHTDRIKSGYPSDGKCQRSEVSTVILYHWQDIAINQCLHKHCSLGIRQNADNNTDENSDKLYRITFKQVF